MWSTALLFAGLAASSASALPTAFSKRDSGTKNVFAHHIVGYTSSYTSADWTEDVTLAHAAGIDGFALNIGGDTTYEPQQVASAYAAAEASGTGFKLFISLDMSAFSCTTSADAAAVRNYVTTYANHPNQFKYDGRVFLSTFEGDACTFGTGQTGAGAWQSAIFSQLTGGNAVYFVPSFFIDPSTFTQWNNVANGMFSWNSGWTTQLTTASVNSLLAPYGESLSATSAADIEAITADLLPQVGSITSDQQWVNAIKSMTSNDEAPIYMGAVTPWFFTHYGVNSYNKNWIYYSDSHLYNTRWEQVIENRELFDLIEILTWNDYSESHYIGPIHGSQPTPDPWVSGFDHSAWLNMTSYYISAYKTGAYPTVNQDQVYIWARPHPKNAVAPDSIGQPSNYQMTQDLMWAVVFNTAPSTVTLWTSDTTSQIFDLPAGVSKISMPLNEAGGYMRAMLQRNGETVTDFAPSAYYYQPNPSAYNFNAFTAGWAGAASSGSSAPPPPPPPPPTSTGNRIHPNGDTSKCLDVAGAVYANGTPVDIYDCNGTGAQNWIINEDQTSVQVAGQNYCLDAGSSPENGTQMKIWECYSGLAAQTWWYTSDDRISLMNQGFCLDLTNDDLNDGTVMQIWSCTTGDTNQIWTLS